MVEKCCGFCTLWLFWFWLCPCRISLSVVFCSSLPQVNLFSWSLVLLSGWEFQILIHSCLCWCFDTERFRFSLLSSIYCEKRSVISSGFKVQSSTRTSFFLVPFCTSDCFTSTYQVCSCYIGVYFSRQTQHGVIQNRLWMGMEE